MHAEITITALLLCTIHNSLGTENLFVGDMSIMYLGAFSRQALALVSVYEWHGKIQNKSFS